MSSQFVLGKVSWSLSPAQRWGRPNSCQPGTSLYYHLGNSLPLPYVGSPVSGSCVFSFSAFFPLFDDVYFLELPESYEWEIFWNLGSDRLRTLIAWLHCLLASRAAIEAKALFACDLVGFLCPPCVKKFHSDIPIVLTTEWPFQSDNSWPLILECFLELVCVLCCVSKIPVIQLFRWISHLFFPSFYPCLFALLSGKFPQSVF